MPDLVLGAAADLTGWLLTYLLHSTVLLAGAMVLVNGVPLRPATRDLLLKVALLGGVLTSGVAVLAVPRSEPPVHVVTEFERSADVSIESVGEESLAWMPSAAGPTIQIRARLIEPSDECRGLIEAGTPLDRGWTADVDRACGTSQGPLPWQGGLPWTWFEALVGAWLAGGLLAGASMMRRWSAVRDLASTLRQPSLRSARLLDGLVDASDPRHHLGGARLFASDAVDAPCVLTRSRIVLPARCESDLTDRELRAVLAHELAHVERRDVLWCGALRLLSGILWVQPLNRLVLARLVDTAEHTCDDRALARTGERVGLARSISRVAHWSFDGRRPAPDVSMAGRSRAGLGERVRRILHDDPPRQDPAWLRVTLASALLFPICWLPAVPAPVTLHEAIFLEERTAVVVEMEDATADPAPDGHTVGRIERLLLSGGSSLPSKRVLVTRVRRGGPPDTVRSDPTIGTPERRTP